MGSTGSNVPGLDAKAGRSRSASSPVSVLSILYRRGSRGLW